MYSPPKSRIARPIVDYHEELGRLSGLLPSKKAAFLNFLIAANKVLACRGGIIPSDSQGRTKETGSHHQRAHHPQTAGKGFFISRVFNSG